jgi:hypothetical protein
MFCAWAGAGAAQSLDESEHARLLTGGRAVAAAPFPEFSTSSAHSETNDSTVRVSLKNEEIVGGTNAKPLQRVLLTAGTNKFAFVAPLDFRVDASSPTRIVMNSPEYGCFISVRFKEAAGSERAAAGAGSWRDKVLGEFPGAIITSESVVSAGSISGADFEFQWTNSSGARQWARTVFLPFGAGTLQLILLTDADRYADGKYFFHSVLLGLRSNERGTLKIPSLPGNS